MVQCGGVSWKDMCDVGRKCMPEVIACIFKNFVLFFKTELYCKKVMIFSLQNMNCELPRQ